MALRLVEIGSGRRSFRWRDQKLTCRHAIRVTSGRPTPHVPSMCEGPPFPRTMGSTAFHGFNYGSQIGANYGSVTNEFHLPWGILWESLCSVQYANLYVDLDDKLSPVSGAAFDSYVDQHEDQCLPGTRTDLLSQISEWASSPQGRCIFWLNGIAGTGKSTISRTMAKSFNLSQSLGASFFFKRGEGDRGNARKLFPTIARQLAISIPEIAPVLQELVRENPGITKKTMREQFEKLLLRPLNILERSKIPTQAMVIVIDALDECDGDSDIRLILQLLPQLQNQAAARLRVLLTSRPDLPIRMGLSKIADDDHKDFVLHDIPLEVIKHDISLFFDYRLTEIRTERLLPSDWPGDEGLQKLVALSVPLFIFASTICRIFEEPDWDPIDSLTEILARQNDQSKLDKTYLPILDRLLSRQHEKHTEKLVSEFQQVIGAVVTLESPLSVLSLAKLLNLPERLIRLRLDPLHSLLRVPDNETVPVRLFHLSFRDFLLDPETRKKTPLGINETEMHYRLAKQCLLMCQSLRKNICGLLNEGIQRTEIDRQTVDAFLPPELQYSCRYWAYHLIKCIDLDTMIYTALIFLTRHFLRKHFLHWVEAMSLLGLTSEILGILDRLQTALMVYCAGLIFAPKTAIIRKEFEQELPAWIYQLPLAEERWGAGLQTLEGHSALVISVAFSPDSRLLATGAYDNTVRVWDTVTAALTVELIGHPSSVESVAFSPNGRILASGSSDNTVRLWDPATGVLIQTIKGHSISVRSVAFSPDSQLLASGSGDNTVRLWDPATGILMRDLEGHTSSVWSVAFSPDGRLLASGSGDNTVRLWNPATGVLIQTLESHIHSVWSVAFSPNSQLLASGSGDNTVRVWNITTGVLSQTLKGHLDSVWSVAFSHNGRLLASGSEDNTVRLWDTATGVLSHTLGGHTASILSVAFSPNGQLLASGSGDNTVRLWDPAVDTSEQTPEGHLTPVQSLAFSPDGRLLASGASDDAVRLWDPVTGALTHTLRGHSISIRSVAFSPDSQLLASGSDDNTVRLWDPATGVLMRNLEGHSSSVLSVAFSPDGRLLASGSGDNTVRLWDLATGAVQILEGHTGSILSVAFSTDGRLMASGSNDRTVRLWGPKTGRFTQTWNVGETIFTVEFSRDSLYLLANAVVLDIQSNCDIPVSHLSQKNPDIWIERQQWIKLNGQKVLWLPVESRPNVSKIHGNILALGHRSGRISFIGFLV
ncbi:unnamed protein product [Penicillium salamii]|nr:unnamed protein product [Penicillium salamii]CAG8312508.1 unnamed protein product [Penicillium salamii]